jgi:SAM-dependent methyltransferase
MDHGRGFVEIRNSETGARFRAATYPEALVLFRHAVLRQGLEPRHMTGLEIGPLCTPVVHKHEGDILYVDHADTETLRHKYDSDPGVNVAAIAPVDFVWGAQSIAECVGGRRFDYVLASHVGEHVPDLVTWLQEMHAVLKPAGQLRLVLPDKRFSFDFLRQETRLSDLLAAHLIRARRPQLHQVLDFALNFAPNMDGWGEYHGTLDHAKVTPHNTFEQVMAVAARAQQPDDYVDVHCSVFTPRSFARLMGQLAGHGLLQLACAGFQDSVYPVLEFYVFLEPCADPARLAASWRGMESTVHEKLPGSAAARMQP